MSQIQALSDPILFLSALTTIIREAAFNYLALYSVIEIGCPNQAKCSCNLSPGGRATRHLCPLNEKNPITYSYLEDLTSLVKEFG